MLKTTEVEPLVKDLIFVIKNGIINEVVEDNGEIGEIKSVTKKNKKSAKFKNLV